MPKFVRNADVIVIKVDSTNTVIELLDKPKVLWSSTDVRMTETGRFFACFVMGRKIVLGKVADDSRGGPIWTIDYDSWEDSLVEVKKI